MKRTPGCFSVYGALAALVVALGVGGWTLLKGPTLFSPGRLTAVGEGSAAILGFASHAEMEPQCMLCHRPWRRIETERCMDCHTGVEAQIAAATGLHGRLDDARDCVACHPDHLGREADIARAALARYPHDQVGFSLVLHQDRADGTAFACADCHFSEGYVVNRASCVVCHSRVDAGFVDRHLADYGAGCLSCHDGTAIAAEYDHGAVLSLDGGHADLACDRCHLAEATTRIAAGCRACHDEPAVHRGRFGTDCAACHGVDGWLPARLRAHAFPLDHGVESGATEVSCLVCHPDSYPVYTCYGCHEHQRDLLEREHREGGIDEIADCTRCHPTGREEEEERK